MSSSLPYLLILDSTVHRHELHPCIYSPQFVYLEHLTVVKLIALLSTHLHSRGRLQHERKHNLYCQSCCFLSIFIYVLLGNVHIILPLLKPLTTPLNPYSKLIILHLFFTEKTGEVRKDPPHALMPAPTFLYTQSSRLSLTLYIKSTVTTKSTFRIYPKSKLLC